VKRESIAKKPKRPGSGRIPSPTQPGGTAYVSKGKTMTAGKKKPGASTRPRPGGLVKPKPIKRGK
jgi:hypothetical protein